MKTSRDPGRSPMQWNNSKNAGFTSSLTAWLRVGSDYPTINVEVYYFVKETRPLSKTFFVQCKYTNIYICLILLEKQFDEV